MPHVADDFPDDLKAVARLPNLDIEIRRRREAGSELVTIALRATPSFEELFGRFDAPSPAAFWLRAVGAAWAPWLRLWGLPQPETPRLAARRAGEV
ncbi:hypothetical protein [Methylocella sp.]|uniref:hypothetical protein n=1 Tax=Methylocella sp. TaxID=1978226 RepID=UPI0035B1A509